MWILRPALPAFAASAALAVFVPASGHAQGYDPYKWCAQYSGEAGGGRNCGFITLEQCRATVSGVGGFCEPNLFYTGERERPRKRARRVHQ